MAYLPRPLPPFFCAAAWARCARVMSGGSISRPGYDDARYSSVTRARCLTLRPSVTSEPLRLALDCGRGASLVTGSAYVLLI